MKKLNRKGFTLIELLAIIVILAIIMVVTIPTVLSSMGNARQSTFETSAQTVADWVEKNYTLARTLGEDDTDSAFLGICKQSNNYCSGTTDITMNAVFLKAAGVDATNYSAYTVRINNNGRACVTLTASLNDDSDFKTLYTTAADNTKTPNVAKSTGCD